jgi:hypothetical protein
MCHGDSGLWLPFRCGRGMPPGDKQPRWTRNASLPLLPFHNASYNSSTLCVLPYHHKVSFWVGRHPGGVSVWGWLPLLLTAGHCMECVCVWGGHNNSKPGLFLQRLQAHGPMGDMAYSDYAIFYLSQSGRDISQLTVSWRACLCAVVHAMLWLATMWGIFKMNLV